MSAITTTMNRLSVLGLVACDMSYIIPMKGIAALEGEILHTYMDSNPELDFFPAYLATQAGIET